MNKYNDYKSQLYRSYHSSHSMKLYGEISLPKVRGNFFTWDQYFGSYLPTNKQAKILDIGCGVGSFVYYLQESGYLNAQGVDISQEQIDQGIKAGFNGLHVGDFRFFLSNSLDEFDLIIARDVIEHFTKQESYEIFLEINKSIAKGGKFLMQVPNGQGLYYATIFYGDYTHEMPYTESSIRQLALNCGFENIRCYPTGPVTKGFFGNLRSFLWWLKVKNLQFWKLVETGNGKGIFTSNLIAVCQK